MNSLRTNFAVPATPDASHVRLVAAANKAPEPDEEFLHPSSSGTPGVAERVAAENFNPNHDDLGRFTFAGGTGRGGTPNPPSGAPPSSQAGSGAPGGDASGGGPQKPPSFNPYWGSYGGGKSGGQQGAGAQKPPQVITQKGQAGKGASGSGTGAAGAQSSASGKPQTGGAVQGKPGNGSPRVPVRGPVKLPPIERSLSSAPAKVNSGSGQSWAAVGREAIAQVSKMTGQETLLPVSHIEEDIRGSHLRTTAGFSNGSSHGTLSVHDLVPVLRKHQIASEDLSTRTKADRSAIDLIGAHLRNGPVLADVSSGANTHAELIMRQHNNGLYAVYNPLKGSGEDLLHASQIDPRGVIALSPSTTPISF